MFVCDCASGKLALQSEELAQKYLPVFARELEVGTEVSVRSNVVVIMCDLCVRYTNMVDHYIPNISACLRDKDAVIREQTLIMLTNLLQVSCCLSCHHTSVSSALHSNGQMMPVSGLCNGK